VNAYDITKYGAIGDGKTDNTQFISSAIEACHASGGGTVYIPAGTFLTGPIELKSHMTLWVDAGALVLFKDHFDAYPPVKTRWSGYEVYGYQPLLFARNVTNVSVKGDGCFDGQGKAWWEVNARLRKGESYSSNQTQEITALNKALKVSIRSNIVEWDSQFLRPPLLQFIDCRHVTLEGITLRNSPFWNTHLVYCDDVSVRGVTIQNPSTTPNGDGLDIDSCSNVRVTDCHFDVGDDCLCLKSGIDEDGRRVGKPTENITISNCTMHAGHGGVVFGSENSGGIRNVVVTNCVFMGTDRGIRIKTNRARGGYVKNILINNIYMEDVFCPLAINAFYKHGVDESDPNMITPEAIPVTERTPQIQHIHISNVTAKRCRAAAGFIYGLPEMPIEDVYLRHITFEMTEDPNEIGGEPDMVRDKKIMAGDGIFAKHVRYLELHRVRVETRQGPALSLEQAADVEIDSLTMRKLHTGTPVIEIKESNDVYAEGRQARLELDSYLQHEEASCSEMWLCGKRLN
jgi:polygalacturonase